MMIHNLCWTKLVLKVAKATEQNQKKTIAIAHELLRLQTLRKTMRGHEYFETPIEFLSFSAGFPYEEGTRSTSSYRRCFGRSSSETPMDRLIIGDVGFGRNGSRDANCHRVVCEGHQVAILCPTTVLALQHYQNFTQRFAGYNVKKLR